MPVKKYIVTYGPVGSREKKQVTVDGNRTNVTVVLRNPEAQHHFSVNALVLPTETTDSSNVNIPAPQVSIDGQQLVSKRIVWEKPRDVVST